MVRRREGRNSANCACLSVVLVEIDLVVRVGIDLIYLQVFPNFFEKDYICQSTSQQSGNTKL